MKDSTKVIIKVMATVLAFVLIISSVFIIRSCSAPPDYEEIRSRVEELIEASHDINEIVWGKGLPTYERVFAPKREFYESGKTYVDADKKEQPLNYYYYYVSDKDFRIVAFREQKPLNGGGFRYAFLSNSPMDPVSLAALYPLSEGQNAPDGLYSEVYSDAEKNIYAYLIPFTEKTYDFYYNDSDPEDYDYVVDSKYASVDAIRDYIRTVYSEDYAYSLDSILFDGVMEGDFIQKARYITAQNSRGSLLASLNTYEPLFKEKRVYLFDTAEIDRGNSNDSTVVVEFLTYLPSQPDNLVSTKLTFVLQDSTWYLASPSY